MPKESHIDISIVIVNYKSWQYLKDCLNSLSFDPKDFSFEIIVIDNQSKDGLLEDFRNEFPKITFIENSGNNGFAHANNLGASKSRGKFLLFLNPDTVANQETIHKMWLFAINNPKVGVISCLQKKKDGGYEKSNRDFLTLGTLFGLFRAINKKVSRNHDSTFENGFYTDWASGSVIFISKEWFDQIEGWNEDYWMYFEDMDLCKRVSNSNGKVAVLNSIEIIHNHGGASRINLKTASITKTEVQISKHIYIHNHFEGIIEFIAQLLVVVFTLLSKIVLAIVGILLFFIPKARLNVYLFLKILSYYFRVITRFTWLSPNSMNNKN